jgi:hypothetical protein
LKGIRVGETASLGAVKVIPPADPAESDDDHLISLVLRVLEGHSVL